MTYVRSNGKDDRRAYQGYLDWVAGKNREIKERHPGQPLITPLGMGAWLIKRADRQLGGYVKAMGAEPVNEPKDPKWKQEFDRLANERSKES